MADRKEYRCTVEEWADGLDIACTLAATTKSEYWRLRDVAMTFLRLDVIPGLTNDRIPVPRGA